MLKPYLEILRLVWPLALGMVNNAVMQFVDRAYLAHDSMAALEAVLPATALAWVFLGFFQSVVGYSGVFVAQYFGARDGAGCVRSYRAGQVTALVSGVLLLALVPLGDALFACTASTPELAALESSYYDIVLVGGVFLLLQMAGVSYFTGIGKTRAVFWVNVVGNVINVAVDPILIFGWCGLPRLGMAGAAYATVFAQFAQFVFLLYLARSHVRSVGERVRLLAAPMWRLCGRILRFGAPAGGYEVLNMASFTIFVFITGGMGGVSLAVSNACFTINYLLFAPMLGFALGAQTLVGHACGRNDVVAAVASLRRTLLLGLGFVTLVLVLVLAAQRYVLGLFAPAGEAASAEFLALGGRLLTLMAVWMLFDAADVIISGALKGAGDTRFVFWWMLISAFLVWLPVVALVRLFDGSIVALWATMILEVIVLCVGTVVRWRRGRWKGIRVL